MNHQHRRKFIKSSLAIASVSTANAAQTASSANQEIRIGLIGNGGRSASLKAELRKHPNTVITSIAEVNAERKQDEGVEHVDDFREILDNPAIDAVLIATPDHWHTPAAILACQAGKHVYVEKPCSHTVKEGRLLVEAATRNKVIVQHGTQVRSTDMMIEAVGLLRDGIIGEVKVAKCWNVQRRANIGKQQPSEPPQTLDYQNWVGPAEWLPYQTNRVNSGWHWFYNFGTGDMGNDGVHDIDYARWGLGVDTHPNRVAAVGGKYFFDDDQQFPDTQNVLFEYQGDGKPGSQKTLIYEQRLWSTNYPHHTDSGAEFYGTDGQMYLSRRGKIELLGPRNIKRDVKVVAESQNTEKHIGNWIDCIGSGKKPNADIETGHLTSSLCHLGNIAVRLARGFEFDPDSESVVNDPQANQLLTKKYRDHWGKPTST
ncbi:MAG: dehydrogenase [Planctomycetaceae bacterium]|nr:dehydrogenase [Planctomycetaceae bacterium]